MHHSLWVVSFADEAGEFSWRLKHYHQISPFRPLFRSFRVHFRPFSRGPFTNAGRTVLSAVPFASQSATPGSIRSFRGAPVMRMFLQRRGGLR